MGLDGRVYGLGGVNFLHGKAQALYVYIQHVNRV